MSEFDEVDKWHIIVFALDFPYNIVGLLELRVLNHGLDLAYSL
jgi:hypothetical protein